MAQLTIDSLVGAWRLDHFEVRFADGRPSVRPFGDHAQGLLIYDRGGQMCAVLSQAERPALDTPRLENTHKAPDAQKVAAFDSYLSYAGTWRLDGDEVVHSGRWRRCPTCSAPSCGGGQRSKTRRSCSATT